MNSYTNYNWVISLESSHVLSTTQWTFVTVTYDCFTARMYVNENLNYKKVAVTIPCRPYVIS